VGCEQPRSREPLKAASDLTQERLTVVEIRGSDGSSDRHRGELEITQSIGAGRFGLGDPGANRFGLNFQCFCSDLDLNAYQTVEKPPFSHRQAVTSSL
jgi:hypothetical protein